MNHGLIQNLTNKIKSKTYLLTQDGCRLTLHVNLVRSGAAKDYGLSHVTVSIWRVL